MQRKHIKFLSLVLAVLLFVGLFAGCTQKADTPKDDSNVDQPKKEDPKPDTTDKTDPPEEKSTKITDKPLTLTMWAPVTSNVAAVYPTYADLKYYKVLEERTGIKIDFKHPPVGQEDEQFNLMVASQEFPDMIVKDFKGYPGGPEKAISDGVIIKLNDSLDKWAPNLKKVFAANSDYDRQGKTDNGTYYTFPFIYGHETLLVFYGPQFRKDWLDELNLTIPETIDEWETVLRTFKEKKNAIPLSGRDWEIKGIELSGAFEVVSDFYIDKGELAYGPVQDKYKDYLTLLAKWYKEGLIDPDFVSQDGKALDAKITSDQVGAWLGYAGSTMGRYLTLMKEKGGSFDIVGVPSPSLTKGGVHFGQRAWDVLNNTSISSACKNLEEAVKWLDYGYSEEGQMLYNFGIEGESYTMVNGYPTYTDIILKNPDGLPIAHAMSNYIKAHYSGPMVQRKEYLEQYMQYPQQVEAIQNKWSKADASYRVPPITATPEESQELANIMNEIKTYVDEMFVKFVMGQESLDKFDAYVDKIKKMNIDKAIEINKAALDRYYKR